MAHDPMDDSRNGSSPATGRVDYRRIEVVEPEMAAILRAKTTSQRIMMMLDANTTMRLLIEGRVKTENSALTLDSVNREVARRVLHACHHSS